MIFKVKRKIGIRDMFIKEFLDCIRKVNINFRFWYVYFNFFLLNFMSFLVRSGGGEKKKFYLGKYFCIFFILLFN